MFLPFNKPLTLFIFILFYYRRTYVHSVADSPSNQGSNQNQESKPLELDIALKNSTVDFSYHYANGVGTYVPKPGYSFGVVKQSNSVIWDGTPNSLYSTHVTVKLPTMTTKMVTIQLGDNRNLYYKKSGISNVWVQFEPEKPIPVPSSPDTRVEEKRFRFRRVGRINNCLTIYLSIFGVSLAVITAYGFYVYYHKPNDY